MEQGRTIVLHNALDLTERGFMALFFGAMAYRLLPHFAETGNIVDICVLISEGASTLFVLPIAGPRRSPWTAPIGR